MTNCFSFVCLKIISYPDFFQTGLSASQQQLVDRSSVGARQAQIEKLYANILNLCQERAKRLGETCKAYQLVREAAELANWIKTKEQHAQIQVLKYTVLKIYPKAPYEMKQLQKTFGLLFKKDLYHFRMSVTTSSKSR